MTIEGYGADGHGMLHVQGSNVSTENEKNILIAKLRNNDAAPRMPVRVLFGVQNGAWGLLVIDTNREVYLRHRYGSNNLTWSMVDISASW